MTALIINKTTKYEYIDALRGLAILAVVMVHTSQYGAGITFFHPMLTSLLQHGARGVQLFFVASALTLWMSMANRKQENHPTRNFFIRRLFRIAPMYYIGIVAYAAWFFWLHTPLVTPANVAANFFFIHGLSPYWINSLVPGGWSITVEMFFYVLAPWLFTRLKSLDHAARFVLLAILLNSAIHFILARHPLVHDAALWDDFLFFYFPSQLPIFGLGILLYFVLRQPEPLSALTLLLAAGMLLMNLVDKALVIMPEHVWFGVTFMALAMGLSRYATKLLVNPFTRYIGKISFSLYLVHFAILFALERFGLADILHPAGMKGAVVNYVLRFCIVILLSSLLATFFYHAVEVPGQNVGKKLIARGEERRLPAFYALPALAILPFFFCSLHRAVPAGNMVYVQLGDSITYGEHNSPGHSPGDYAVRELATPTTFIKLAWPGESAREFNQKHRLQLQDSLAELPLGHRVILGIAYGANDLNLYPKRQAVADVLRLARWATDTLHIKEVLLIPVMNRTDKYGFTRENDMTISHHFNETRRQFNAELRAEIAKIPGVRMANESDSPAMFADNAPADITRFADQVHPLDPGAKELGEGTIGHGIGSFEKIKLK